MKKFTIIFWITPGLLFLTQGVMPILTFSSAESKQGLQHLGYPSYFALMLAIFKLLGALAIVLPFVPGRIKEWAFAGFAIDFICGSVSYLAVDGVTSFALFPLLALLILMLCYFAYHKKSGYAASS